MSFYDTLLLTTLLGAFFSNGLIALSEGLVFIYLLYRVFTRKEALIDRENRLDFLTMLPLAAGVIYGILISDNLGLGWREGRSALQLLLLPVYADMVRYCKNKTFFLMVVLGVGLEFALALFEAWQTGAFGARIGGHRYTGTDGLIAMLLCTASLFFLLRKIWIKTSVLGLLIGLPFLLMTQSRAPIMSFILLIPLIVWKSKLPIRKKVIVPMVILILASWFVPGSVLPKIQDRVSAAWGEFTQGDGLTSMGNRRLLWLASLRSFSETDGLGTGYGDFRADYKRYQTEGHMGELCNDMHAHSIYMHPLMTSGFPGFLGVILTLGILLYRKTSKALGGNTQAHLQILILLTLILNGMMDAYLEDSSKIFTFAVFWVLAVQGDFFEEKKEVFSQEDPNSIKTTT